MQSANERISTSYKDNQVRLSVCMITYNHELFIERAIESILDQKVNFEYEIVIGEDHSTDKTKNLIFEYQKRYPEKFRLIINTTNIGAQRNFFNVYNACQGRYIALLEGDDYWIDIYKLQKQVDYMDNHPECAICFHNARVEYLDQNFKNMVFSPNDQKEISTIEDLLERNYIPTASTVYRNRLFSEFPDWFFNTTMGDWGLHILNAQHGNIGYIDEVMSVYRIHKNGIWSSMSEDRKIHEKINFYRFIGSHLAPKFQNRVKRTITKFKHELDRNLDLKVVNCLSADEREIIENFTNPRLTPGNMDLFVIRNHILNALKEVLPELYGTLLDVGCGQMPYKQILLSNPSKIEKYIGLDIINQRYQQEKKPDLFWDGERIPLEDNSVDCAMATEVFEHMPDIEAAMIEIYRVLKPNGFLFFTVPFLWPLHDIPYDEYRYTPYSLERHLKNAGFKESNLKPLGGWDSALAQMIGLWVRRKPMNESQRVNLSEKFFPIYKELIQSDVIPEKLVEGTMITGLSGTARKPLYEDSNKTSKPDSSFPGEVRNDICLGIFTPNIGTLSETFIHRHIQLLAPFQTVVAAQNIFDSTTFNCPLLKIPDLEGPNKYPQNVEETICEFLSRNRVTHLLIEYGCYNTGMVELNYRKLGLPIYVHFHGGDGSAMLRDPKMVEYYRWMGKQVTGIIAVAGPMAERLADIGIPEKKIYVNHYGIEIPCNVSVHPEKSPCSFISVMRLVHKKGPIYLLKSFAKAKKIANDITLDIVGDGFLKSNKGALSKEVHDFVRTNNLSSSIRLHGAQNNDYVIRMLAKASVYVQHSIKDPITGDSEGLPNSILEASASGLPVIATRHEGIPEEVEHNVSGFLCNELDVDKMAEYMITLAKNPDMRKEMGLAGRNKIEKEFEIKGSINNLRSIIGLSKGNVYIKNQHDAKAPLNWTNIRNRDCIKLYAGDIPELKEYKGLIGLSLTKNDSNHICHDITKPFHLPDNCIDFFQVEDVFEHIEFENLFPVLDEIHRILKPGALFRISMPDYGCDVLFERSIKDHLGNIIFDPEGGGTPQNPGHVWFPNIDLVRRLLEKSKFNTSGRIEYLHYYNMDGTFVTDKIDYSKGYIHRTPDFDRRVQNPYRPISIVVDLVKRVSAGNEIPSAYELKRTDDNGMPSGDYYEKNQEYFTWQMEIGQFGGRANLYKFQKFISQQDHVIDFGCGGGYLLKELNCHQKIGIEVNAYARKAAQKNGIKAVGRINEIPDNFAHVIISNHALEHVENPYKIITLLSKKLRDNGQVIFVVPYQDINQEYNTEDINRHLYSWNRLTLGNLFKHAGYNINSIDLIQHQWPPNYMQLYKEKGEEQFHQICRQYAVKNDNYQIRIIAQK